MLGLGLWSGLGLGLGLGSGLALGSVQCKILIEIAVNQKEKKDSIFWGSILQNSPETDYGPTERPTR